MQHFSQIVPRVCTSVLFIISIFDESMYFTYSSTGYNFRYGCLHIKTFCIADFNFGSIIRHIRCYHGLRSPFESLIEIMSVCIVCLLFLFFFSFFFLHFSYCIYIIIGVYISYNNNNNNNNIVYASAQSVYRVNGFIGTA